MPRRTKAVVGGGTKNDASSTMFDETKSTSPVLPTGLEPSIRKAAKKVLTENPHLHNVHVPSVIRLVQMREHFETLQQQVAREGAVVEDRFGGPKANPAMQLMLSTQNAIVRQENILALTIVGQREMLTKEEQADTTVAKKKKDFDSPMLRVA